MSRVLVLSNSIESSKYFIDQHPELDAVPINSYKDMLELKDYEKVLLIKGHNWNIDFNRIFEYIRTNKIDYSLW